MTPPIPKKKIIRSETFTSGEDTRLMSHVMKYKDIIECKQTDHKNNL